MVVVVAAGAGPGEETGPGEEAGPAVILCSSGLDWEGGEEEERGGVWVGTLGGREGGPPSPSPEPEAEDGENLKSMSLLAKFRSRLLLLWQSSSSSCSI